MKKIWITLLLISLFSTFAFATDTRMETMQVGNFVLDNTDPFRFPARIVMYPNQILGELTNQSATLFFADKKQTYGAFGLSLNRKPVPPIINKVMDDGNFVYTLPSESPKFNLIYGNRFGALTFGIGLDLAGNSYDEDYPGTDADISESFGIFGFNGGVKIGLAKADWVDLSISASKYTFSHEELNLKFNDQGKFSFGINARIFYTLARRIKLVPFLGVNTINASWEEETDAETTKKEVKSQDMAGGVGVNMSPSKNLILVFGLISEVEKEKEIPSDEAERRFETSTRTLPEIVFGFEATVKDWLKLRGGASKSIQKTKEELTEQTGEKRTWTTTTTSKPFSFNFGLGIKLGKIVIDGMFNTAEILDAFGIPEIRNFYFLTGPFNASVTYIF